MCKVFHPWFNYTVLRLPQKFGYYRKIKKKEGKKEKRKKVEKKKTKRDK